MAARISGAKGGVVVWEWQDDLGEWIPYDSLTCQEIEQGYMARRNSSVQLGKNDPRMSIYEIDFTRSEQRNTTTGALRPVKRHLLPGSSASANGIVWQWERGPKHHKVWFSYPTTVIEYIEEQFQKKKQKFKFPLNFNMPYSMNLINMTQINLKTNFSRKIQRQRLLHPYPQDSISARNHIPTPLQYNLSNPLITTASNSSAPHAIAHVPHVITHQPPARQNNVYPNLPGFTPFVQNHAYPHSSGYTPAPAHQNNMYPNFPSSTQNHVQPTLPGYTPVVRKSFYPSILQSSNAGFNFGNAANLGLQNASAVSNSLTSNTRQQANRVTVPPCPRAGIPCALPGAMKSTVPITDVLKDFTKKVDVDQSSTEQCAICQSPLTGESGFGNSEETRELNFCKHVFHTECIEASYEHSVKNGCIVCPACSRMHGIKTGTQPPGIMTYSTMPQSLPGYMQHGAIQITYNIRSGIQSSEHPHPGKPYHPVGFPRIAYLPDNDPGRKVLLLLIEAWKRRLVFTVGQSSTTGMDDCVIWSGIHHKTEFRSQRGHGYPDDTYLDRVTAELEAEGVVADE